MQVQSIQRTFSSHESLVYVLNLSESPVTLREMKLRQSAGIPSAGGRDPYVPRTERDALKYKAQKSNIVFGYFNPFSGKDEAPRQGPPPPPLSTRRPQTAHH